MSDPDHRQLPSPEKVVAGRQERLAAAFTPAQTSYLPTAMLHQLNSMTERIYPANAVNFLTERVIRLEKSGLPASVFAIEHSTLPEPTQNVEEYPVIDYLSTVYPGSTIVPIKQLAMIERAKRSEAIAGMDPIIRRQLSQQGLLESARRATPLSPDVIDSNLQAATRVEHIFGVLLAAERCHGNQFKTDLWQHVVQQRLAKRSASYDQVMQAKHNKPSNAAAALRELSTSQNLSFIQDHIHTTAGSWANEKFPRAAEVHYLESPTIEQCLQIFDNDIFWFADWSESAIKTLLESFKTQLPDYIYNVVLSNDQNKKSINGFSESAFPSPRAARYIEMYTGTSLPELVAEQVRRVVTMDITLMQTIMKEALAGDDLPVVLDNIIHEFLQSITKEDSAEPANTEPVAATPSNVVDLATYRQNLTTVIEAQPHSTVAENLKIILQTILHSLEFTPPEFRARYFGICQTLDRVYITEVLRTEKAQLTMTDLYTIYRNRGAGNRGNARSIFNDILRLTNFVLGDQDRALTTIYGYIDEALGKMTDTDFAALYTTLYNKGDGGSFFRHVVAAEKTRTVYVDRNVSYRRTDAIQEVASYDNVLPKAQQRLTRLLTEQPTLFSDALIAAYQRWRDKK